MISNNENSKYVLAIGAANIDLYGFSFEPIYLNQSNPGTIDMVIRGGSRNVCENLSLLGVSTKLISAFGDDYFGDIIKDSCIKNNIDIQHSLTINNHRSSVYLGLVDSNKDVKVGLSDMSIEDFISVDYLKSKAKVISNASAILLGAGLLKETLEYVINSFYDKDIFVDASSIGKAKNIKDFIHYPIHLKMNFKEAQFVCDTMFSSVDDIRYYSKKLVKNGLKSVSITLGEVGAYVLSEGNSCYKGAYKIDVLSASGAGDAFLAGMLYSYLNQYDCEQMLEFSMACSSIALMSKDTVKNQLSLARVQSFLVEQRRLDT